MVEKKSLWLRYFTFYILHIYQPFMDKKSKFMNKNKRKEEGNQTKNGEILEGDDISFSHSQPCELNFNIYLNHIIMST